MYVGMTGLLVANALRRGSWLALPPVAAFTLVIDRLQVAAEEAALVGNFGADYEAYRAGSRTLIFTHSIEGSILRSVPTAPDLERMLRGAALRVTRPRMAVLSAVHDHPHADTDSIIRAVREDLGEVSHQAVYDVLRALTATGLLRRIQPAGSVARYESRVGDNHHHVVCRSCGAIADVDCAVGAAPCLVASDDHGFAIDEAEVTYWARCPDCQEQEPR
jgi:Fur family ferric uptake transcriptional regulator